MSANRKYNLALLGILLLAALVRLPNLGYDLPSIYEEATPMRQAWEMWNWGGDTFDFNPHFFNYPALYFYIQFIGQILYFGFGWLIGRFHSPGDMRLAYEHDPSEIVLLARCINVGVGLLTLLAVARLGRRVSIPAVGLIAGGVLAVLPLSIHTSRTILVDAPLVFFITLSLCAIAGISKGQPRSAHLSGLWIGLAAASKYTGAILIIPLVLTHLRAASLRQVLRRSDLWIGLALSGIVFSIVNPFCILDSSNFWRDFSLERQHIARGHFGVDPSGGVLAYGHDLWRNFGPWFALPLLLGLGYCVRHLKQSPQWMPLLVFSALYLGIIATWSMHAIHYLLPVFPVLTVLTARGILDLYDLFERKWPPWLSSSHLAVLFLLIPAFLAIRAAFSPSAPDPRTQAQTWAHRHIPRDALIAQEFYTPDLAQSPENPPLLTLHIPIDVLHPERTAPYYDLRWYTGFDYLMTSNTVSQRYTAFPDRFQRQIQFYQTLAARWPLVAEFADPTSDTGVQIYRNPNEPTGRIDRSLNAYLFKNMAGANLTTAKQFLDNLGLIYKHKGWPQTTASLYGGRIGLDPADPLPYLSLARLLIERGKTEPALARAIQILTEALKRNPDHAKLQNALSEYKALRTGSSP